MVIKIIKRNGKYIITTAEETPKVDPIEVDTRALDTFVGNTVDDQEPEQDDERTL